MPRLSKPYTPKPPKKVNKPLVTEKTPVLSKKVRDVFIQLPNGKTVKGKNLTRKQARKLVNATADQIGAGNALAGKAIKGLTTAVNSLSTMAVTLETLGNSRDAEKARTAAKSLQKFLDMIPNLTPDQLKALEPLFTRIKQNTSPINPNKQDAGSVDDNQGTIIL